jgi:hypothetical protein
MHEHPLTGAEIAGRKLPHWPEVTRMALEAHNRLSSVPSVGWDIAISNKGPVFLEANVSWNPDNIQTASGTPIGATEYGLALLAHLRTAFCNKRKKAPYLPHPAASPVSGRSSRD